MFLDSMRINISPPPRIKSEEEFVTFIQKVSSAHSAVRLYKRLLLLSLHISILPQLRRHVRATVQISFSYDYFGLNPLGGVGSLSRGNVPKQNLFSYPYVDSCTVTVGCVRHLLLQCENASEKYPVCGCMRPIGSRVRSVSAVETFAFWQHDTHDSYVPQHFSVSPPLARSHAEHP